MLNNGPFKHQQTKNEAGSASPEVLHNGRASSHLTVVVVTVVILCVPPLMS